jgi:hypothetical protein
MLLNRLRRHIFTECGIVRIYDLRVTWVLFSNAGPAPLDYEGGRDGVAESHHKVISVWVRSKTRAANSPVTL